MNVVLVCLNNFQEYILDNIQQLLNLGVKNIYIITDLILFDKFSKFDGKINMINTSDLSERYDFYNKTNLDKNFRNGFWTLTSLRFFYIYDFMIKYDIKEVIHLENDVLLYYNPDILIKVLDKNYFYIPFDCYNRNIASIIYIPNSDIFGKILDRYNFALNDMENFRNIMKSTGLIEQFPIFHSEYAKTDEEKFVSKNYNKFNYIFDAAAIGQYLGGIDPNNDPGNTVGFVNETCVIKYNNYVIKWKLVENMYKPFLLINETESIPIFNLHIHCKNLKKFIKKSELFDIVICVGPSDKEIIKDSMIYTKKNIIGYRNIYLISYDADIKIDGVITIDERIFPFDKEAIKNILGFYRGNDRSGWYLQQLIKLYAGRIIPDILENYLIIDSDTYFLNPVSFINENGKYLYNYGSEYHMPYFEHMGRLHGSLRRVSEISGICHHCLFNKNLLEELFAMCEKNYKEKYVASNYVGDVSFWHIFLRLCDRNEIGGSAASEYEIYFNFLRLYHSDKIVIRKLRWKNSNKIYSKDLNDFDYVSVHHYLR